MSKAKDIARAETEGVHRDGKTVPPGHKVINCVYPPCNNTIAVHKNPTMLVTPKGQGPPPFCPVHLEMLQFVLWLLPQVQIQRGQTTSGLILPNQSPAEQVKQQQKQFMENLDKGGKP